MKEFFAESLKLFIILSIYGAAAFLVIAAACLVGPVAYTDWSWSLWASVPLFCIVLFGGFAFVIPLMQRIINRLYPD